MKQVTLLFILGFAHALSAAAIYEFPDLTRRLPERRMTPGCAYRGGRYDHGEQVQTPEPCLNCTCIRAIVVCYLRVCPSPSAPPPGCFYAREVGQCCPTLVCGGDEKPKPSIADSDLRPTFQPQLPKDDTTLKTATEAIPTTTEGVEENSLMFVTSTKPNDETPFPNDIPKGCLVNGTLYGDGSAMISSSFCEYCFCIRGKTKCVKPKCDLVIDGCAPYYDSQFSCCPSKYHCHPNVITDFTDEVDIYPDLTTKAFVTKYSGDHGNCILDGTVYLQGEVVPEYRKCHNCFCSQGSIICDKIKCSPSIAGCLPVIPEDHCCPVSYKCDYHKDLGSYNIKASKSNGSNSETDMKRTDVKTVKQSEYFKNNHAPNLEARPKSPERTDDLTTFFDNFVPVHRRLDENIEELYHSPDEDFDTNFNHSENSTNFQIKIGQSATPYLRENDKTLNLEVVKTIEETTSSYTQTENDVKNNNNTFAFFDSTNPVSVGPPETQTISIRELFAQLFGRNSTNNSKQTANVTEPKRNNSKQQPSDIYTQDTEKTPYNTEVTPPLSSRFRSEDYNYDNNSYVSPKTTLSISDSPPTQYVSNGMNNTISRSSPKSPIEHQYESTTPIPLKLYSKETTGSVGLVTARTNKNTGSTTVYTTLYFLEDETISQNESSRYIITGTKNNRIYSKSKATSNTPIWHGTESLTTENSSIDTTLDSSTSTQNTKAPNRINNKVPGDYNKTTGEDSVLNSTYPLVEESLVNLYLPSEGRNDDSNDFTNVGAIHLGAPLSVEATELRRDPANLRNKITESGGVIFMDPKYTDIAPNQQTENLAQPTEISSIQNMSSDSTESSMAPIKRMDTNYGHYDRKKGPRIQDAYNQTNPGQDYKIIPFVAEDAIRGKFGKVNNTFHVIPDSTQSVPDMVSDFCFIKGRIFMNGEMIPKVDPCELCRCFYGQELCQLQRCPTPPPNCIPEKLPAFCCPRFTCGNNSSFKEQSPPPQRITINTQPNSQFVRPINDHRIVEKPDLSSPKPEETKFGTRVRLHPTQTSKLTSTPKQTTVSTTGFFTTAVLRITEPAKTTGIKTSDNKRVTTSNLLELAKILTTKETQHDKFRLTTTRQPEIAKITKKVPISPFSDPWGLLKVSGCNIYGKFFNINDQVEILSGPCSHCICTTNGVECNDIC
ncbi:VWFC domain-containing protein [Trichonephila clavata]|uniref:VWFC domain-containing protein n=1 Tax=Trichonephila clavata TaxID=2740835 RepID=A0A8X6FD77_TRICU|nr:VWFC domain-containing protein [Trichonephila clavata]